MLGLPVLYLFVFAAASTRSRKDTYPPARRQRRFVTLIPAYKSDAVIVRTAQAALQQDYPQELHEVVVIADRLQPATLAELRRMPIRVLEASFENSSKARALNFAVGEIGPGRRGGRGDTRRRQPGGQGVHRPHERRPRQRHPGRAGTPHGQEPRHGHRRTRRSERGGQQLDLPPRACGAGILFGADRLGMAFDYKWFRENIACCTTSGEDKELEALLLRQGIYIDYLDDVRVLDEKVQGESAYYNQRRRWIAAQFYALSSAVRQLPGAILSGNTDYCDKLLPMVPAAAHPAVGAGAAVGRRYDGMRTHGFDKMVGGRPAAAPGHGDGAARRAGRRPPGACPSADARPVPADAG